MKLRIQMGREERERTRDRESGRETKTENWFLPFPFQIQLLSENAAERGNPRKGKKERERMRERKKERDGSGVQWAGRVFASQKRQHFAKGREGSAQKNRVAPDATPDNRLRLRRLSFFPSVFSWRSLCACVVCRILLGRVRKIFENCICCAVEK